ncbi:hypothetical protein [Pseudoalteromonas sp. B530]|uniref:hypothetical protein n=1 Tax=Pseudoalteromonas sp. B530 TaxID=2994390 RepID=UPI00224AD5DB|nr:hypothetical protein [Pseudoalteromonas sp. B530]MCX2766099.1 hypothetical protein [Pseudoalteromonas sp. B530]
MIQRLFLIFALVGSFAVQANNESIQLAKEYLEAVLLKDYENVEKFIEVSAYTKIMS